MTGTTSKTDSTTRIDSTTNEAKDSLLTRRLEVSDINVVDQ